MRNGARICLMLALAAAACLTTPALAVVPVVFGTSWDGASNRLQDIVYAAYGAGRVDCVRDYIGALPGDSDPFFWVDNQFSALLVKEVAGNANRNTLGWYLEDGHMPAIDGIDDGVVFSGPAVAGATALIHFDHPMTKFGFWLNPNGKYGVINAPEPEKFYTNRFYNE